MEKTRKYLQSVGLETFIKYYHTFELNKEIRSNQGIKDAFDAANEEWTEKSINAKATCGKAIFVKGLATKALTYVSQAKKTNSYIRLEAQKLLQARIDNNADSDEIENFHIIHTFTSKRPGELAQILITWALEQNEVIEKNNLSNDLEKLIQYLQENITSDKKYKYTINSNEQHTVSITDIKLTEQKISNELIVNKVDLEKKLQFSDLEELQYDNIAHKAVNISYTELRKRFIARLKTQNRQFSNGIYFYPILFNRFKELRYNDYINSQIEDIEVYTKDGDTKLNNYAILRIEEGKLYGLIDGKKPTSKKRDELLFKLNNTPIPFDRFVANITDISLEHVDSMWTIINDLKETNQIPHLIQLSTIMQEYGGNYRTKTDLDKIQNHIESNHQTQVNLTQLKKELDLIHSKTKIELMPRLVNIAKGHK